jgi:hypothetical protein
MKFLQFATLAIAATSLILVAACSDAAAGSGKVAFTTWGEEYIEQEIPSATFADGWTIKYTKYLVVFRGVQVGSGRDAVTATSVATRMPASKLIDHTKAGRKALYSASIPAQAYDRVSYEISPADAQTENVNAAAADQAMMLQNGYSIFIEATATKAAVAKRFAWGFKTATLYDRCEGEISGKLTSGVVVTNGGTDTAELTIHGDHFYYDDLQSPSAKVRFDNIAAADADNNGEITFDELAKVKLAALPASNGPYGVGSAANVVTLADFVTGLSRTIGHYRGEGECFAKAK